MMDYILSRHFNTLILLLIPILSVAGTILIMYADKKKIKTDPLIGLYKTASELNSNNVPIDKIKSYDNCYYPHNKRMKRLKVLGVIMIIFSAVITIYKIYN